MSSLRAVGFDLDGTLFEHRGSATAAADGFLAEFGVVPTDHTRELWFAAEEHEFERWRAGDIGFQQQRRNRVTTVFGALGLEIPDTSESLDALFDRYLAAYRAAWRLFPDSGDVLRRLRLRGVSIGILTNGAQEQQREKLERTGLVDLVDAVCVSEEIGARKPDRRAFSILAERLGVAPDACHFIGDNPEHDVAGARDAGMSSSLIERHRPGAPSLLEIVERAVGRL
ncbi:HAD family hydrolase [Arthrobacter sp. Y-9]|uniref:HAD family hydrolase n=1 Tax=Arthrobacter sp. Y-9 TaxID=3039385 RepID=UPI00241F3128|nr:HAD family hydrolase [Arthrobacter sp. Y-9]WFR83322.1 HAD family hydrolase [Arthrobacter sp. Y-9]